MIGKLTGIVDSVSEDHAILDVGGVGYLVSCPTSTLSKLSAGAQRLADDRNPHHRRNDQALRILRRRGARMVSPAADGAECRRARGAERAFRAFIARTRTRTGAVDKAAIGRAQGVGPKLALRIVTELKDKAPSMMLRGHADETVRPCSRREARKPMRSRHSSSWAILRAQASRGRRARARDLGEAPVDVLIRECLRQWR